MVLGADQKRVWRLAILHPQERMELLVVGREGPARWVRLARMVVPA